MKELLMNLLLAVITAAVPVITTYATSPLFKGLKLHTGFSVPAHFLTLSAVGNTITVIEGNMNGGVVGRRTLKVNGRYIRGFALIAAALTVVAQYASEYVTL